MPPTTRENEIPADAAEARSGAVATNGDTKQQPVALEVPVTVNGARTIEGDKREPFSETTKTVLIFGNGAVIRLTSSVAPGQLLFLTNERTKKEVVCQVVKSKNYKNVSGYVELEFTEPVVGFWGMRFPADRIGPPPQAAPAATPPAAASSPTPARQVAGGGAPEPRPLVPPVPVPSKPAVLPSPSAEVSATRSSSIVPPAVDSSSLLSASKPKAEEFPLPIAAAPPTAKEPSNPAEFAPPSPNFSRTTAHLGQQSRVRIRTIPGKSRA